MSIVDRYSLRGGSSSREPFRRPILEQLAPRLLLNGVTLITHGHNTDTTGWISTMADAVADRVVGDPAVYTLYIKDNDDDEEPDWHNLIAKDPALTYDTVDSGEAIIKIDWSDMTDGLFDFDTSTLDVGYYAADWLAASEFAEAPIHLIGHSRGGSVVSATAKRLAEKGIWIDQLTTLDPHPISGDAGVFAWDTVRFADNYWRTGDYPDGQPVSGAYDRELNDDVFDGGWFSDVGYSGGHSDVHLWYHGTIDITGPVDDGTESLSSDVADEWYDPEYDMPGPREQVGYHYSRIAGGDRSELGGWHPSAASRVYMPRSGTQWANLAAPLELPGPLTVQQGDGIPIAYRYQSAAACDISFGFDADRNPYNASAPDYLAATALPATSDGTAFDNGLAETQDIDTSTLSPGMYYPVARISVGGLTRYAYSSQQVVIEPPPVPGDADDNGVVDDADLDIFSGQFGIRGSDLSADFDADGLVGLSDFAILRANFESSPPSASPAPSPAPAAADSQSGASPGLVTSVTQSQATASPSHEPLLPAPSVPVDKFAFPASSPVRSARKPAIEHQLPGVLSDDKPDSEDQNLLDVDLLLDALSL